MTALVLGASGFLGSHVTRALVADGQDVRVLLRRSSSTKGIDDLDVERCYGGLFDDAALRGAMAGCDVIHYCVVDARMWLRDPAPLFHTNIDGLRNVLDIATERDRRAGRRCPAAAREHPDSGDVRALHPQRPGVQAAAA